MPWKRISPTRVEITPEVLSCGCTFDMLKSRDENRGFTYCAACKAEKDAGGLQWVATLERHRNELAGAWGFH